MNWKCRVLGHDKMTMLRGNTVIDLGCKRCGHISLEGHADNSGLETQWHSLNGNRDLTEQIFYKGYSNNFESVERPLH